MKAFADNKLNVSEKFKFVLERVENIVGKGENAGYQHFLFFPECFQKASVFKKAVKGQDGKEVKSSFLMLLNTLACSVKGHLK